MKFELDSDVLWSPSENGKKYWRMRLYSESDGRWGYTTLTWRDRVDGSLTDVMESEIKYVTPTNVGKSNERGSREQAIFQMQARVKKMLDWGYTDSEGNVGDRATHDLLGSMLAHKYDRWNPSLSYVFVQPKLDGVRCLTDGMRFWSRGGKFFPEDALAHIQFDHDKWPEGLILDGELMMPLGEYTFQDSVSRAKRYRPDGKQGKLKLHVYDCFIQGRATMPYKERKNIIFNLFQDEVILRGCSRVVTSVAECGEDADKLHAEFIGAGYEGSMIRNPYGIYAPGQRSMNLLKRKDFIDEEFEITGVREGVGKEAGHAIFICKTVAGREFETRPRGSYEQRAEWWRDRESLVGKMLTVRYQNMTDDGSPRFPIGLTVRDYE